MLFVQSVVCPRAYDTHAQGNLPDIGPFRGLCCVPRSLRQYKCITGIGVWHPLLKLRLEFVSNEKVQPQNLWLQKLRPQPLVLFEHGGGGGDREQPALICGANLPPLENKGCRRSATEKWGGKLTQSRPSCAVSFFHTFGVLRGNTDLNVRFPPPQSGPRGPGNSCRFGVWRGRGWIPHRTIPAGGVAAPLWSGVLRKHPPPLAAENGGSNEQNEVVRGHQAGTSNDALAPL